MDQDELFLENLPPEVRLKLNEVASSLGRSDEEIAAEIVQLVLKQCADPGSPELQQFVQKAKAALG